MEFPQQFGKYTLLKRLATGGMAEIFLAKQEGMGGFEKEVVVKRLLPAFATQEDRVQMFMEEGRIAAALTHPNIAQIFDLGREQDDYYIAMEYVHGVDLRRVCSQGIAEGNYLPLQHAVRVIAEVLDALHYAHTRVDKDGTPLGIVHQDVTPTNILVTFEGGVKLVDFGVARSATSPEEISGMIAGKAGYMSPEQVVQGPVDARADIFAAGINLYEITVGRRLFRGEDGEDTLAVVDRCEVPRPRSVNPDFPDRLERVIMRALSKDPEARYADARAMQIALEDFLASEGLRSTAGMLASYMQSLFKTELEMERARSAAAGGGLVNLLELSSPTAPGVEAPTQSAGLPGMGPVEEPDFPQGDTVLSTIPSALLESAPDPEEDAVAGAAFGGLEMGQPTEDVVPEGSIPEGSIPESSLPESSLPESSLAEESVTEAVTAFSGPEFDAPEAQPEVRTQAVSILDVVDEAPLPDPEPIQAQITGLDGPTNVDAAPEMPSAPSARVTRPEAPSSEGAITAPAPMAAPAAPLLPQTPAPEIPAPQAPAPQAPAPQAPVPQAPAPAPVGLQPTPAPQSMQRSPLDAPPPPLGVPESQPGITGTGDSARLSASALLMPPDLTAASDAERKKVSDPPPVERSLSMSLRIRRSYTGLLILLLVVGAGVGLYYVMTHLKGSDDLGKGAIFEQPTLGKSTEALPPPPLKRAMIRITSEPLGARVVVNGNLLDGKTPTSVETFVGRPSTIRLLMGGYLPAEKRVIVEEGGADLDFKLKEGLPTFGALKVESAPEGAKMEINGNPVGETPKAFPRVAARNDMVLRLTKEGFYPQHVLFKVPEGQTQEIPIRMVPDAGPRSLSTILVESVPTGALIYDVTEPGESKLLGRAGTEALRVSRKPDTPLRLRAELDGYDPTEWDLDVRESHYTVYIQMVAPMKFFGKLTVKPKKKGQKLTIFVGNAEIGKTPVVDHPLEEGEHTLVLFDEESRARAEVKVSVKKDGTVTKLVSLSDEGQIVVE